MPADVASEGFIASVFFAAAFATLGATFAMLFLCHLNQQQLSVPTQRQTAQIQAPAPVMTNKEVIEWKDWRGRSRTITIHREVH